MSNKRQKNEKPNLFIKTSIDENDIDDFNIDDFSIINYKHGPFIKLPVAV